MNDSDTTNQETTMNTTQKLTAILGWKIRYYEPTFGMREFLCAGNFARKELNDALGWLDAGGHMYTVSEVSK